MILRLLIISALFSLPFSVQQAHESAPAPFTRLPGVRAIAFNAQGGLFASLPDSTRGVVQVLGPELSKTFASTGGSADGLAFDARGDLYVADSAKRAILRITPSGVVTVAADRCGGKPLVHPSDVAVVSDGIFFADAGAAGICSLDGTVVTGRIPSPSALAVSSDGRTLVAGSRTGEIWRVDVDGAKRRRLGKIQGSVEGLALDVRGNIYAAGETGLTTLGPNGRVIRRVPFRGGLSDLAFGQAERSSVFLAQAESGRILRMAVPFPSQANPWEALKELRINEPIDGQILNRHDGVPTAGGLRIKVRGEAAGKGKVTVNGMPVELRHGSFAAEVEIRTRETTISAEGPAGLRDELTVVWDAGSFPRYRVSIDDNVRWLKDIATHNPPYSSIFENPYLAFWRDMHRKYGAKVHFNIYYETEGFALDQMPDRYRRDWQENADWIRLTFHARANDPERPYIHSTGEQIREDYRLVTREIERFAGKELLSDVTTIHWGEATPDAVRAIRAEGIRVLVGYFELRRELPTVSYDVTMPQLLHLSGRDYWKDVSRDLLFVRHDMVINGVPLDEVVPRLEKLAADPHQSEIIELMIHEQYWYPDYVAYLPDYRERVERAIQWVTRHGYKPVFFGDGFIGNSGKVAVQ